MATARPEIHTPVFTSHQMDHVAFILDELGRRPNYGDWYCEREMSDTYGGIWGYLGEVRLLAETTTKIRLEQLQNGCTDCLDNMLTDVCERLWHFLSGSEEFPSEDLVRRWVKTAPHASGEFLTTN